MHKLSGRDQVCQEATPAAVAEAPACAFERSYLGLSAAWEWSVPQPLEAAATFSRVQASSDPHCLELPVLESTLPKFEAA